MDVSGSEDRVEIDARELRILAVEVCLHGRFAGILGDRLEESRPELGLLALGRVQFSHSVFVSPFDCASLHERQHRMRFEHRHRDVQVQLFAVCAREELNAHQVVLLLRHTCARDVVRLDEHLHSDGAWAYTPLFQECFDEHRSYHVDKHVEPDLSGFDRQEDHFP